MKKILVTTSLVTLFAATAFADAPMDKGAFDLKFTGSVNAQAGTNFQRKKETPALSANNKNVAIDSEVLVAVDLRAKTARGLMYGAHIGVAANTMSTVNGAKHLPNRTFIFAEANDMGRVEFGTNEGAADIMMVGAGSMAAATGGTLGDWSKYMAFPKGSEVNNGDFIVNPVLPLDNKTLYNANPTETTVQTDGLTLFGNASTEKARKVTYLSPVFEGAQLGVSYIPDASNLGFVSMLPNSNPLASELSTGNGYERDAFTAGIWWNGSPVKDHHLKVSLTGNYGKVNTPTAPEGKTGLQYQPVKDTFAGALGVEWGYSNFTLAGSFGWLGKTGLVEKALPEGLKSADAWYATAGLGVKVEKSYTSLTGAWTTTPLKNRVWNVSAGTQYEVAPGFLPYAELTYVDFNQKATGGINPELVSGVKPAKEVSSKNTALILILGTKVKF